MGAGVSAAASAPGAGKSIDFGDINLRAYRGVSEFTNESHIIYNTRMDAALADYRSNPSLNGMPADKVGLVNKSDVLLGTREFVEADFLDFVAQYGFKKDPGANILDGWSPVPHSNLHVLKNDFRLNRRCSRTFKTCYQDVLSPRSRLERGKRRNEHGGILSRCMIPAPFCC